MSKHTQGEWIATGNGVHVKTRCVATTHMEPKAQRDADARLIAAAPDLFEALVAAVECGMVPQTSASEGGAAKHSRQVEVADMIRAAIAKATKE